MNPGVVGQYRWLLALLAGGLAVFAALLLVTLRRGVGPARPWSFTRATAPPDDASLYRMLLVLLALALLAGAVPLFATAFVYRWFHSGRVLALLLAALASLAVPVVLVWRAPAVAAAPLAELPPRPIAALALLVGALVVGGVLATSYREPAPPAALLVVVAGFTAIALLVGAAGLAVADSAVRDARIAALAHWTVCSAALLLGVLAVAMTAQTTDIALLAQAQRNTTWYALTQPAAAVACLAAAGLAGDAAARGAVLGLPGRLRRAAEAAALLVLGGLWAAVFLGGGAGAGPWLPPVVWLAVKAVAAAAVIAFGGAALRRAAGGRALRVAWLVAGVTLANVAVTATVLALRAPQ
jgi:NADH-quinone oxidoreductase subunit H